MSIWQACRERIAPGPLAGKLVRVVESQEQVATTTLVDHLAEQAMLEDMLDRSKPAVPRDTAGLHYLLATPFRYPPLPHGSRFGSRHEPGLFYGSKTRLTALAESAYYRFVFWSGMAVPPASGKFITQHTVFGAGYRTASGLRLQAPPFDAWREQLTDPGSYAATQQLGTAMRENHIEAFEFVSARDRDAGISVALFSPAALSPRRPLFQQSWLCETSADLVSFYSKEPGNMHHFPRQTYLVGDRLPQPAV